MYQLTSTEFNSIMAGASRHFYCKLSRTGEELTGFRSVKVTQQANPETDSFTIGGSVATVVEVQMDKPRTLVTGKEYQLSFGLEVNGVVEWCPICLVTPEKPKENDGIITFTAYDRMVTKLNYPYYTGINTYPVDAKTILQEISTKTGVSIANLSSLPAGIMIYRRSQESEDGESASAVNPFAGYTYRETVKYIAQLYGTFATMNRTGQLEFRWYKESGYTVELNRSLNDAVLAEAEYEVQRIICAAGTGAIPGMSSGWVLDKFWGQAHVDEDGMITAGTGATGISIENPVMDVMKMEAVWSKIKGFKFTPTTVSFLGDCRLDLGDIVTVKTKTGNVKVPIMGLSYECDGGLTTEIGSYGSTEAQESSACASPSNRIVDYVNSEVLLVKNLVANKISTEYLEANYATIKSLDAVKARIDEITATDITVEYLKANYAKIDMLNVDTATIRQGFLEELMVKQGIIADRVSAGTIIATDVLTGVNIYADDITAGTLSVDRLILRGTDKSLVYAINNSGDLVSTQVDSLDAYILTERTITADKIVAKSLTATEIDVSDLRVNGFINANQITSVNIAAGAITAEKINVKTLESISAKIGGFTIGSRYIANGTTTLGGVANSVYLGLDGISCGTSFAAYADGTCRVEGKIKAKGGISLTGGIWTKHPNPIIPPVFTPDAINVTLTTAQKSYSIPTQYPPTALKVGLLIDNNILSGEGVYFCDSNSLVAGIDKNGIYAGRSLGQIINFGDSKCSIGSKWKLPGTPSIDAYLSNLEASTATISTVYTSNWFRSTGATGWINNTYSGGWYMTEPNWIRVYGSKKVYVDTQLSSGYLGVNYTSDMPGGGYRIYCNGKAYLTDDVVVKNNAGYRVTAGNGVVICAAATNTSNNLYLGQNDYVTILRGSAVYLKSTSTTVTSDLRKKENIGTLDQYEGFFDRLKPISFTYKTWEENGEICGSTSGRKHFGFGAQDVYQALLDSGFTTKDFAGYVDFSVNGGADELGIAPTEFIPLNTYMIQKTRTEVEELREKVTELENQIKSIKAS